MIRAAKADDAKQICNIYNYYVENTVITFEEELVSFDEMAKRIQEVQKEFPWFVHEIDGKIVGYAYASKWRTRSAYRFTVESTVYVDINCIGKGIGTSLYKYLIKELKNRGFKVVIGSIALPNNKSIALHEKLGFEKVAHFSEVGFKHNKWIDVGFWQYSYKDIY